MKEENAIEEWLILENILRTIICQFQDQDYWTV
jgi:hypothetical protein